MGKLLKNILFITFILFTTIFSKENDGREIIKAYDKGKPAKMDIEITKVKSDNFINMTIDRYNKKIYKDISKFSSQNKDLQKKIYVTNYIKKFDKSNLRETFPHEIILKDNKTYLEIDYSNLDEPEKIYLWIVDGKKIDKLYTGIMDKEYFDPNNPLTFINLKLEEDEKKQIINFNDNSLTFKIGEISLKNGISQALDISIPKLEKFYLFDGNNKFPVKLYFNNKKDIQTLDNSNKKITLYGKFEATDEEFFSPTTTLKIDNNNKKPYLQIGNTSKNRSSTPLELSINDFELYFVPISKIEATFDINKGDIFSVLTKPNIFLSYPVEHSNNILIEPSGFLTNKYLIFDYQPVYVTIETNEESTTHRLGSSVHNINKDVEDINFLMNTKKNKSLFIQVNLDGKTNIKSLTFKIGAIIDDVIIFNFSKEAPSLEIKKEPLEFKDIILSDSINTYYATAKLEILSKDSEDHKNYTFNFGDIHSDNKTEIFIEGTPNDKPNNNEKMIVQDLMIKKDISQNKPNKTTYTLQGTINKTSEKLPGIYSGIIMLNVVKYNETGGKF